MPAILGDAKIKKKFQDQEYLDTVEQMFREKFIENLSVSCKLLGSHSRKNSDMISKKIQDDFLKVLYHS